MIRVLSLGMLLAAAPALADFYSCSHYSETGGEYKNWSVVIEDGDGDGEYKLDVSLSHGQRGGRDHKRVYYDYSRDGVTVIDRGADIYTSAGRTVGVILTAPRGISHVGAKEGVFFSEKFGLTLPLSCSLNGME